MTIDSLHRWQGRALGLLLAAVSAWALPAAAQGRDELRPGDYIAAVVNQELVTAGEVQRRVERAQADAQRRGARLPPEGELRRQVLDALIDERVIITSARDSGLRVDEPEIDRAVAEHRGRRTRSAWTCCAQRLAQEGMDYRALSRQPARPDDDRAAARARGLPPHPGQRRRGRQAPRGGARASERRRRDQPGADPRHRARGRRRGHGGRAARPHQAALARVRGGEAFDAVAREVSEDGNRQRGGEIGLRPASRLPDVFVDGDAGAAARRGDRRAAAQRRRLPRAEGARAQGTSAGRGDADARAPHPAAPVGAAHRRGRGAPAGRVPAADREPARAASRTSRANSARTARRRPAATSGWAAPGRHGAGVRGGDERACRSAACRRRWCRASACT